MNTKIYPVKNNIEEMRNYDIKIYLCKENLLTRIKENFKFLFACANKERKQIILFPEFEKLSDDAKKIILWHEFAHIVYDASEEDADKYAMTKISNIAYKKAIKETREFIDTVNVICGTDFKFKRVE